MAIDARAIAEFADREPDLYWCRTPGRFVSAKTGEVIPCDFDGTIQQWYGTLPEMLRKEALNGTAVYGGVFFATIIQHCHEFRNFCGPVPSPDRIGSIGSNLYVYSPEDMPEDRFIVVEMKGDTLHDLKVGVIVK